MKGTRGRGTLEKEKPPIFGMIPQGISQENLALHLAFFEFTHNVRQRGKALFESLITALVKPST